MKQIAVLLTVHNRKEKTLLCLNHLFTNKLQDVAVMDVYLTDDGCTDGTSEDVERLFPSVKIVRGNGTLFWNRGMRASWCEASKKEYDYYLWLNDDTYLYENAVQEMLDSSKEMNDNALIAGATRSEFSGVCTYGLCRGSKLITPNGTLQDGDMMNGNFVLVPNTVFYVLGMLDPFYQHSSGDNDYGLMALEQGFSIKLTKGYIGTCERHADLAKWCNPHYSLVNRFRALNSPTGQPLKEVYHFDYKHHGIITALFHCATTLLWCIFPSLRKRV